MEQSPNQQAFNPNLQPRGAGGPVGHVIRMILTICTGGFAFPNSFVEGMDLTAIQKGTEGVLYDKQKGAASKARF